MKQQAGKEEQLKSRPVTTKQMAEPKATAKARLAKDKEVNHNQATDQAAKITGSQPKKLTKETTIGQSTTGSRYEVPGNLFESESRVDTMETEENHAGPTQMETQSHSTGLEGRRRTKQTLWVIEKEMTKLSSMFPTKESLRVYVRRIYKGLRSGFGSLTHMESPKG